MRIVTSRDIRTIDEQDERKGDETGTQDRFERLKIEEMESRSEEMD